MVCTQCSTNIQGISTQISRSAGQSAPRAPISALPHHRLVWHNIQYNLNGCSPTNLWLPLALVGMKVYVVPLFFRLVLVSILLGSVWRDVRSIFLKFLSDSLDSTLMRFEARVVSSLSERRPAMDSFSVFFVAFLAFAAAMTATLLSLIFLRFSFNFACLAFCLARIRVQHEKKKGI